VVLLVVALAALDSEALELAEVHVKSMFQMWVTSRPVELLLNNSQLPFNVGWQDLKDLFRQAGMCFKPSVFIPFAAHAASC
jgi:hypothetical protein